MLVVVAFRTVELNFVGEVVFRVMVGGVGGTGDLVRMTVVSRC